MLRNQWTLIDWKIGKIARKFIGNRYYSITVENTNVIKLIPEYNRTLNQIIRDNRPILEDYLNNESDLLSLDNPNDSDWNPEDISWLNNASMSEESFRLADIRRRTYRLMNREYEQIREKRSEQPKLECSIDLYDRFMRQMYPEDEKLTRKRDYFANIFKIYCQFPFPAPKYIQPGHLEDLISLLMSRSNENSHFLFTVLVDMAESGLPITSREQSIALFRFGHSLNKSLTSWQPLQNRYQSLKSRSDSPSLLESTNMGFLNALLGIAYSSNNRTMILQVIRNLRSSHRNPNRITLATCMLYEASISKDQHAVKSILNELIKGPFVLDMATLNLAFGSLLKCGLQDTAEHIFQSLLQRKIAFPKISSENSFKQFLQRKVEMMDFLLSVVYSRKKDNSDVIRRYSLPLIPDVFTYSNFIGHYCRTGQEKAALGILKIMISQGVLPDRHVFYRLYGTYANRSDWTTTGLRDLTGILCNLYHNIEGEIMYTLSLAKSAVSAYVALYETRRKEIDELMEEFHKKKNGSMGEKVYQLLMKLREF